MRQARLRKPRFCKTCNGTRYETTAEIKDHDRLERMAKRAGILLPEPAIIIPNRGGIRSDQRR